MDSGYCEKYDVTFVLPRLFIKYPPGGGDVVYRLANALNKKGIKTSILFLARVDNFIENYDQTSDKPKRGTEKIKYSLFFTILTIFYDDRIKIFYKIWNLVKNIFNFDYNYEILNNVDCYLYDNVEDVKFTTKLIFATAWETAYFVREFLKTHNSKPFYLIQNSTDDISFSGKNSILAKKTYDFNFKKVVINKKLYDRFKDENPYFFHVGIDTDFYKPIRKIDNKNGILFPLRKSESKGSIYASECIEKLIQNNVNIVIRAFGDFDEDELPENIKRKIQYYRTPSRRVLRELYNMSSIFVLPSIVEGMSLPPLEAMACRCAVIVTDNGGVNEYIIDGYNGLMCPVKDSQCLYEKIIYLLNNKDVLNKLIQNGFNTALKYSYRQMEINFMNLLLDNHLIEKS